MKKVLMIAFHYPPSAGSSGIQRTLKFTQYLPKFGWEPIVLTVGSIAHPQTDQGQMSEIPRNMIMRRCLAFDAARHFSTFGKYPGLLALPDRWSNWILSGVPTGLHLIRKYRPAAIWSTYPIATAHLLGLSLAKRTGLPWIADFRDWMTGEGYPADARTWRSFRRIESRSLEVAGKSIFTTPGTLDMYRQRYPDVPSGKFGVIENAFDEESFSACENRQDTVQRQSGKPLTLVHSGILYPSARDPRCFFNAIATIKRKSGNNNAAFRVILRATGHDEVHLESIRKAGISDIVEIRPSVSYREAISEMLESDVLLLFQASNCNHQIPAKLYEYIRAKRPILALTDPKGDTAAAIKKLNAGCVIPLDDQAAIERKLPEFLERVANGKVSTASDHDIEQNTRMNRTEMLAKELDILVG